MSYRRPLLFVFLSLATAFVGVGLVLVSGPPRGEEVSILSSNGARLDSLFDGLEPSDLGRYMVEDPEAFVALCDRKTEVPSRSLWASLIQELSNAVEGWRHPAVVHAQGDCHGRYISFYETFCGNCWVQETAPFGGHHDGYNWDWADETSCPGCITYWGCYAP